MNLKLVNSNIAAATLSMMMVAACLPPVRAAEAWNPLFNGENLDGWKTNKPADMKYFKVDDGCLVGFQDDGKGGDLYTDQDYDNFELRFKYKIKKPANSGIWFRGKYQFDILEWKKKNKNCYSGTLYCPGKMFITENNDPALEKNDDWNEAVVYANGDHLVLYLNGEKVGDCRDATLKKGPIGLQVHQGKHFKGMEIRVKDMGIRPLEKGDVPSPEMKTAKSQ